MSDQIYPKRIPSSRFERAAGFANLALKLGTRAARSGLTDIMQGQKPSATSLFMTPRNFENIAHSLAHMRGAAMKLGQLISMDDTLLPPELSNILARLRADGYSMPPKQLREVLNQSWGDHWLTFFKQFDVRPFAAASIGQVHKATLRDGRLVAIKVQFPNIKSSIKSDIDNLRMIIRLSGLTPKGVDPNYYLELCREQLIKETDYRREAQYLSLFHRFAEAHDGIKVPQVVEELSNETVLCMSYETGYPLDRHDKFNTQERDKICTLLVNWTLSEIFEFHVIQSDPNFANYMFDPEEKALKLFDFGASIELPRHIVALYYRLLGHVLDNNRTAVFATLMEEHLLPKEMPDAAHQLIETVLSVALDELHGPSVYRFGESKIFDLITPEAIQEMSKTIPSDQIPAELLLTQRKLIGLVFLLRRLGAELPLRDLLEAAYRSKPPR